MTRVRLFISDPQGTQEHVRYLPVRIGRHPENDCCVHHRGVSRFHLELDWADSRLQLRDLGSRNGVLVRVAGEMRRLRGSELTTAAREVEFAIAGIWVRVEVEERALPGAAVAVQRAVEQLLQVCAHAAERDDGARAVLGELERGLVLVRGILQAQELSVADGPRNDLWVEVVGALRRWTQASIAAVSYVESALWEPPGEKH
jgi:hypothetical protein